LRVALERHDVREKARVWKLGRATRGAAARTADRKRRGVSLLAIVDD
jgi:hypothetical protein